MPYLVLPLRMVAFQALLLLIAIAIESYFFREKLAISPKQSIQYAISVNLLSTVVGWLLFFVIEPTLPFALRQAILNLVLFDRWTADVVFWLILGGFITFFVSLFVKLLGLLQLQTFLGTRPKESTDVEEIPRFRFNRRAVEDSSGNQQANAVLIANAFSYSAIFLVLLLRLVAQNRIGIAAL